MLPWKQLLLLKYGWFRKPRWLEFIWNPATEFIIPQLEQPITCGNIHGPLAGLVFEISLCFDKSIHPGHAVPM